MLYLRIKGNSLWSMVKERTSLLENTKLIGISVSFLVFNRIFVRNFLSGNSLCVIHIAKFFSECYTWFMYTRPTEENLVWGPLNNNFEL